MPRSPRDQPTTPPPADARRLACHIARLLDDSKCEQVLVLDLRDLSPITDYFVIGTGASERQIVSLGDDVRELARQEGQGRGSPDASGHGGGWVVADFFDVVVHLFSHELRGYYDLESLWGEAPRVDWRALTTPGQFARLRAAPVDIPRIRG